MNLRFDLNSYNKFTIFEDFKKLFMLKVNFFVSNILNISKKDPKNDPAKPGMMYFF
jgi:hypothetical protein